MTARRRPWVVFVRDIGPTFTFASSTAAHARALELVTKPGGYLEVVVWERKRFERGEPVELLRTVYRAESARRPMLERFVGGRWVAVRPLVVPAGL